MDQLPMKHTMQCCISRFGIICLSGLCSLSILLMVSQMTTYTYLSDYTEAQIAYEHCLQSHEGYILPSTVQASQVHAPWKCPPGCSITDLSSLPSQVA